MTAGRQRAFAALYYAARGLESAAAGLYHAAAGLMTHADLHAAITEEWRRFPSSEEPSDASLFDWEKAFYARFLERTDKILLVGCGTGRDLIALLQCGHRVDGVDLVREAVVRARQRLAEHKFEGSVWVGDIETIELVERYDVFVFSWFCLRLHSGVRSAGPDPEEARGAPGSGRPNPHQLRADGQGSPGHPRRSPRGASHALGLATRIGRQCRGDGRQHELGVVSAFLSDR